MAEVKGRMTVAQIWRKADSLERLLILWAFTISAILYLCVFLVTDSFGRLASIGGGAGWFIAAIGFLVHIERKPPDSGGR